MSNNAVIILRANNNLQSTRSYCRTTETNGGAYPLPYVDIFDLAANPLTGNITYTLLNFNEYFGKQMDVNKTIDTTASGNKIRIQLPLGKTFSNSGSNIFEFNDGIQCMRFTFTPDSIVYSLKGVPPEGLQTVVSSGGPGVSLLDPASTQNTRILKTLESEDGSVLFSDHGSYIDLHVTAPPIEHPNGYQNGTFVNILDPGINFTNMSCVSSIHGVDITQTINNVPINHQVPDTINGDNIISVIGAGDGTANVLTSTDLVQIQSNDTVQLNSGTGNYQLVTLPTSTVETNVLYVDGSGKVSKNVISRIQNSTNTGSILIDGADRIYFNSPTRYYFQNLINANGNGSAPMLATIFFDGGSNYFMQRTDPSYHFFMKAAEIQAKVTPVTVSNTAVYTNLQFTNALTQAGPSMQQYFSAPGRTYKLTSKGSANFVGAATLNLRGTVNNVIFGPGVSFTLTGLGSPVYWIIETTITLVSLAGSVATCEYYYNIKVSNLENIIAVRPFVIDFSTAGIGPGFFIQGFVSPANVNNSVTQNSMIGHFC